MLTPIRKAALGVMAFAFGVGLGAADFLYQKVQAGGDYSQSQYTELLIERFDGAGGTLGLIFRKSARVAEALPPAPEGWTSHLWSSVPYSGLYSRAQRDARARHLVYAVPDVGYLEDMGDKEKRLLDVYLDDVSRVYLAGKDGKDGYIDLSVTVPGRQIGSAVWQRYLDEVARYYDRINSRRTFGTIAGLTWAERRGTVEMASSQDLPHDLRVFETRLGLVKIRLRTRVGEASLRDFMARLDVSALRELARIAPDPDPQSAPDARPKLQSPDPRASNDLVAQLVD